MKQTACCVMSQKIEELFREFIDKLLKEGLIPIS
jgi:hypothetical protein